MTVVCVPGGGGEEWRKGRGEKETRKQIQPFPAAEKYARGEKYAGGEEYAGGQGWSEAGRRGQGSLPTPPLYLSLHWIKSLTWETVTLSRRWSGEKVERRARRWRRRRENLTDGVLFFEEGRGNSRAMCLGAFQFLKTPILFLVKVYFSSGKTVLLKCKSSSLFSSRIYYKLVLQKYDFTDISNNSVKLI